MHLRWALAVDPLIIIIHMVMESIIITTIAVVEEIITVI